MQSAGGPTRSGRKKFRVQPFHNASFDAASAETYLVMLRLGFNLMLAGHAKVLVFSELFNMAYKLCLWKWGARLYDLCTDVIKRASLCTPDKQFRVFTLMVRDVVMYCERTYVLVYNRAPLTTYAANVYARDVARRWRRVRSIVATVARAVRVMRRRAAWDEVRFRPGGSGWLAARASFRAHSARV